LFQRYEWYDL